MKVHIQYIFTEEEVQNEELQNLIAEIDEAACQVIGELASDSVFWKSFDISSEDKVEG